MNSYIVIAICLTPLVLSTPCVVNNNYPTQSGCFNAQRALYERFPLLYKVYATKAKILCDKIRGINPCPAPATSALTITATCPEYQAEPSSCPACQAVGAPCPACQAAAALPPDCISTLLSYPTQPCPCCS